MTKDELKQVLIDITSTNTAITNKQGVKCQAAFKRLDRLHQKIAKALRYEFTKDELEQIGQ